jgi:F-type H+-transporting ATPase subunit b
MPQLDASTFIPQLFWLAVTFIVLFILMKAVALPRVDAAIGARRTRLDDDLAAATEMKTQAEAAIAAYEHALAEARTRSQMTIKQTSDRLATEAAERQRQLAQALAEQVTAAERQIAEAKARAVGDIRSVARDVAASVAARLTGAEVDAGHVAAAVDRALAERGA